MTIKSCHLYTRFDRLKTLVCGGEIYQKDDVGEKVANYIVAAREGKMSVQAGGGGVYGKVSAKEWKSY